MAFSRKDKQRIIDEYLSETGRNMFIPAEFIDWLADQPEHEAYPWFYGTSDAEAAREHRISLARRMASGLRIVAVVEQKSKAKVVSIKEREYPAFVSPVAGRRSGGGYTPFNPDDAKDMAELRRQGVIALQSWLRRYGAAFDASGYDLTTIKEIAGEDSVRVAQSA